MELSRRTFLGLAAVAACAPRALVMTPPKKLTILVLGGTKFLGPHVVDAARARGHTVTLFNRGKTNPQLFPDVEKLHGDRDGHLEALAGRRWDAVIDDSGYVPRVVEQTAKLQQFGHYVFISTISVYAGFETPNAGEDAPLARLTDPASEDVGKDYGALKAGCEAVVRAGQASALVVRPGLIVGPGDPTGRFTHWPARMDAGGEVLAPGDGTTPMQYIDARDLAAFLVHACEQRTTGTMNALTRGPSTREVLDACNHAAGDRATLTWVPAEFLAAQHVEGWSELPAWSDPHGDMAGFGTLSNARAVAAGLTFRPVADTARDTLAWLRTLPDGDKQRDSGLARDKEAAVLAAWRARTGTVSRSSTSS